MKQSKMLDLFKASNEEAGKVTLVYGIDIEYRINLI